MRGFAITSFVERLLYVSRNTMSDTIESLEQLAVHSRHLLTHGSLINRDSVD